MCLANEEEIMSLHMDNLELDRLHFETNFKIGSFCNTFMVILINFNLTSLQDYEISKATCFIDLNSVLLDVSQDL